MKKILYITYNWPPRNTAGIYRVMHVCNFLSQNGFDLHVLTADKYFDKYIDDDLSARINKNITVHKAGNRKNLYKRFKSGHRLSRYMSALLFYIENKLIFPDEIYIWKKNAIKRATELINKYDFNILYTSSPYFSCAYVGLRLKKCFGNKIKLITEFRDLPSATVRKGYYKLNHKYLTFERDLLLNSSLVIADNPSKIDYLVKTHKLNERLSAKLKYFYSGYPDYFSSMAKEIKKNNHKIIRYVGGLRGLSLIPKLDDLLIEIASKNKKVIFEFVGTADINFRNKITLSGVDNIIFKQSVSLKESHKLIKDADGLLLLMNKIPNVKIMTSIKIFPYIASGNFVFAVVPAETNAAQIIRQTKTGHVVDPSHSDWPDQFTQLFDNFVQDRINYSPDWDQIDQYSTTSQLNNLLALTSELQD